jgi:ATP adenylyltransferase
MDNFMSHLFATWRMDYVTAPKHNGCIFCDFSAEESDEERFILYRGAKCFVIMNVYPYNPGHMMVAPYRHTNIYEELSGDEHEDMSRLTAEAVRTLKRVMAPEGFNIGINLGRIAGAGIADHLHLHIVPRWNGDTNFMPVLADTRVVPEALRVTYRKLKESWGKN